MMRNRPISPTCADPGDDSFDPIRAAIVHQRNARIDEAYWMVFLFVHFGKHARGGYRYAREVYSGLGEGLWTWARTSANPAAFRDWLHAHREQLKRPGVPGGFGSHRKYESLNAYGAHGTGAAVESYVNWVSPPRSHAELVNQMLSQASGDPRKGFDLLYRSMRSVVRFGRTARFDYLAMVGKLELAAIEPGSTYLQDATGPVVGARLLFGDTQKMISVSKLDELLARLDQDLDIGMQALEDALCNWQKSPRRFRAFRG